MRTTTTELYGFVPSAVCLGAGLDLAILLASCYTIISSCRRKHILDRRGMWRASMKHKEDHLCQSMVLSGFVCNVEVHLELNIRNGFLAEYLLQWIVGRKQ